MKLSKRLLMASALLLTVLGAANAFAGGTAYVVHGIPGGDIGADPELPVDIAVNGECTIEHFTFGSIVGPVGLPAGEYDIAISLASESDPCSNDPVIEANGVPIEDGGNYSIVAHLDEDGAPTASVFENELDTRRFTAQVNVAHAAAAPAVDVQLRRAHPWWLPRSVKISGLSNGEQVSADVVKGRWKVSIFPAGSRHPVFGPESIKLEGGIAYGVFAVGSLDTGSFTLLLTTLEEAPSDSASAFVVHGIPGADLGLDPDLPVDVSVNGECTLEAFQFGEIVGPVELPAGTPIDIAIGLANADTPCSNDPVIEAPGIELAADTSYSIVAHLLEGGGPTASVFENNLSARRFTAVVNAFHTADAPAVDIRLQRSKFHRWVRSLDDVSNGQSGSLKVLRGPWNASIAPAGEPAPVFGPVPFDLEGETAYFLYAVGSLTNDTFTVLVNAVPAE